MGEQGFSRRSFVRGVGVAATGLGFGSLLASCGSNTAVSTGSGEAKTQVIVAMGSSNEPAAGFNPAFNWGCGEHMHEPLIQSTLINTTVDMGFVNDLATDYSVSPDGLVWSFTIRDDVRFSDGEPLTASDVAFTLTTVKNSESSETDLGMIEKVDVLSDTELVIGLTKPYNALLYTLAVIGIVPEHAYGSDYGSHPIGSGRYILEQWDQGQQVIFAANPSYYGEAPKIERFVVVFMDEDAALGAVRSGEVDLAATSAIFSDQSIAGFELLACASVDSRGISFPCTPAGATKALDGADYPVGNGVTSEIALRRAINLAVDRDALVENVLAGYGSPAFSVSDGMPWASADMKVKTDVEEAQRLLTDAGYSRNPDGGLEKDGLPISFQLWYPAGDSVRQGLANEFANQLADIGIRVELQGASWDDIYLHRYESPVLWGWGSNSPTELYSLYHSTGASNFSGYSDAKIDAYLEAALSTPEVEDSNELWRKAQWDGTTGIAPQGSAPWVWLTNIDHLYFKRTELVVARQKPHPHGHGWSVVNNVDQWSWAE